MPVLALPLSRDLGLCGKGPQETHHLGGGEAERLRNRETKQGSGQPGP